MMVSVCFDISNNRTRRKAVKVLETYGKRVQKSVFECHISDKQYVEMKSKMSTLIKKEGDLVRYYRLCERCRQNVEFVGGLGPEEKKRHLVV